MTQEDKELLLKDLCARLPYGFFVHRYSDNADIRIDNISIFGHFLEYSEGEDFKPYLRPMSSMTDEERDELWHLSEEYFGKAMDKQIEESLSSSNRNESEILEYIASSVIVDWLNSHHLDYRGLIEKGLALKALEGMYKI